MKLFRKNREEKVKKAEVAPMSHRQFEAAVRSRLYDWVAQSIDMDSDIKQSLGEMRDQTRDLAKNNDYLKRYLELLKTHVVGPVGVQLQCRFKNSKGELDDKTNDAIEKAFKKWSRSPEVTGKHSWVDVQKLVISTAARDGEAFVRKVLNTEHNKFKFSLQLIDAAVLDHKLNVEDYKGNEIKMGIELDEWGAPVAYYFKTKKTRGKDVVTMEGTHYLRIKANEIYHVFASEDMNQSRGVPWCHTSVNRFKMLSGYEQAELVASRVAASKMGFFKRTNPDARYSGEDEEHDDRGNVIQEADPGSMTELPFGVEFQAWDPEHPGGNFKPFVKAVLRGASTGLNISYNTLANDLEGVNYSSLRAGLLEERDYYKSLQQWFINSFLIPVYQDWLKQAVAKKQLKIKIDNLDEYEYPKFMPRRWAWVDPLKDTTSALKSIEGGLNSRTAVAAEQGRSLEDVLDELEREEKMIQKKKLKISGGKAPEVKPEEDSDDDK